MADDHESFAELMLRARAALGQTQAAFGRSLGVSTRTVVAWEAGDARRLPSPERLVRIISLTARRSGAPSADELNAAWARAKRD